MGYELYVVFYYNFGGSGWDIGSAFMDIPAPISNRHQFFQVVEAIEKNLASQVTGQSGIVGVAPEIHVLHYKEYSKKEQGDITNDE